MLSSSSTTSTRAGSPASSGAPGAPAVMLAPAFSSRFAHRSAGACEDPESMLRAGCARHLLSHFSPRIRVGFKLVGHHGGSDSRPRVRADARGLSRKKVEAPMKTPVVVAALLASAGVGAGVAGVAVHASDSGGSTTVISRPVTVSAAPAASTSPSGGLTVSQIYQKAVPGVVEVLATGGGSNGFFGGGTESAQGTGFEADTRGDVVTNYHVVENADSVRVRLHNGKIFPGIVIGTNKDEDLAVIRISAPASQLHPLTFADSSALQVGDSVVAIG